MRRSFIAVVFVAATACLAKPAPQTLATPEKDRLEVDMPVTKARAIDRVVAAFVAESLEVASADVGGVRSRPIQMHVAFTDAAQVTYVATIYAPTDSTTHVVLVALSQDLSPSGTLLESTTADARAKPVKSHYSGPWIPFWQRLERIAARLQAQ